MSHKNQNIVNTPKNLDELLDMTDSEDASTSSSDMQVFERSETFVLELHELKRDELPDNPLPEVKTRKLLRKKKREQLPTSEQSGSSLPSTSVSESSVAPVGTDAMEEFYDAHESYHALPENQAQAPVTSAGVVKVYSEHSAPKLATQPSPAPESADAKLSPPAQPPPAPATEPSTTVTKPVIPPE